MDAIHWGPYEHALHARIAPMRAAEYNIPIIRATSSGISQIIRPDGTTAASLPYPDQSALMSGELITSHKTHVPPDRTLAPLCTLVAALIALSLLTQSLYRFLHKNPLRHHQREPRHLLITHSAPSYILPPCLRNLHLPNSSSPPPWTLPSTAALSMPRNKPFIDFQLLKPTANSFATPTTACSVSRAMPSPKIATPARQPLSPPPNPSPPPAHSQTSHSSSHLSPRPIRLRRHSPKLRFLCLGLTPPTKHRPRLSAPPPNITFPGTPLPPLLATIRVCAVQMQDPAGKPLVGLTASLLQSTNMTAPAASQSAGNPAGPPSPKTLTRQKSNPPSPRFAVPPPTTVTIRSSASSNSSSSEAGP